MHLIALAVASADLHTQHERLLTMLRQIAAILSATVLTAVFLVAFQGTASAQDGCTYSVSRPTGPAAAPAGYRSHIVGRATWTCRNAPGIRAEIRVELFRNGDRVKSNVFSRYGTFTQVFAASVPCTVGTQRMYFSRTYGFDGGGPTIYVAKSSSSIIMNCL